MATFGKRVIGATASAVFNNELDTSFYTAGQDGIIVALGAYCSNPDGVPLGFKLSCWANAGGLPTTKLGETGEINLINGAPAAWREFPVINPFPVVAGGVYHLGHAGVRGVITGSIKVYSDAPGGSVGSFSTIAYPTLPATAVTPSADTGAYSIYAVYDDGTYIASIGRRPVPMIQGPDRDFIGKLWIL